jgi:hypothetical protein
MLRFILSLSTFSIVATLSLTPVKGATTDYDDMMKCLSFNFKSDGTKEDTIRKIFAKRDCIKQQQRARIGKWFCYVTNSVGIQTQSDGTTFAGKIKPETEKFVATIKEIYPGGDEVRKFACEKTYGLSEGDYETRSNVCLSTFSIDFSPRVAVVGFSEDTYHFDEQASSFTLFGTNEFVLFSGVTNSYVYRGRCEKID